MKIVRYEYHEADWEVDEVHFGKFNLLVGESGVGKTRVFNTLFNIGVYVVRGEIGIGNWELELEVNEDHYFWCCITKRDEIDPEKGIIVKEKLSLITNDSEEIIVDRDETKFIFNNKEVPKLSKRQYSLSLLQEEEIIKPIYEGFTKILRRMFYEDALKESTTYRMINIEKFIEKSEDDLFELLKLNPGLNIKLYILEKRFPDIYSQIIDYFLEVFPFIENVSIKNSNDFKDINFPSGMPIFCVKEYKIDKLIKLQELSSGMQKALLIITDILSLPKNSIYLIDEYENSLGVSVISLLPEMYMNGDIDCQIFVSSHHPYIIRNIPVENWYILNRKGNKVQFRYGADLVRHYNISNQDKYLQLINDEFYTGEME